MKEIIRYPHEICVYGIDTQEYELNLNPNSSIYEEQQMAAAALNGQIKHSD